MRVVRESNPIIQQFGRGQVGSGMQVGERTGEVMVLSAKVRVSLVVWLGEMQIGERMGHDGDECSSSGEVGGMSKGDAVRREDGYGDGDERNSSGDVDSMGRGKGGGGVG